MRHSWDLEPKAAVALQRDLAAAVVREGDPGPVRLVAGVDVSMNRFDTEGHAAIVVLALPDLEVVEVATASATLGMPYIPGLLSFRELPIVLAAWDRLREAPDLVVVDGHGIAHPRRLGIAAHLGVVIDRPTIGCAKTLLVGAHDPLPAARGSRAPLVHKGEEVGVALRTKDRVNPVFVSVGHRIGIDAAVRWILELGRGYRLPEPTRRAHLAANEARRGAPA
jgi:deoxyribonuclease V